MLLQQSRECNSNINDSPWPVSELTWDYIYIHLICKFQEHPIETEWVMLITKSNRNFFSNQGDVTLRWMIRSDQFSNLSEISSFSTLSASFRNILNKLSLRKHAYSNIYRILPAKNENFQMKNSGSFHISALSIGCWHRLSARRF